MKSLLYRWFMALLIASLLLTPPAFAEEASSEALDPAEDAPVSAEPVDIAAEETEADLDADAPITEAPELDLDDEAAEWFSDTAYGTMEADPEPVYGTDDPIADDDALFEGYVRGLFGLDRPALFEARNIGGELTGAKRALYDALSGVVSEIAAGRRASTEYTFANTGNLSREDIWDVIHCVNADHPYEMYWYANGNRIDHYEGSDRVTVCLNVGSDWAAGEYTFNTATVATAARAAANARAIVDKYAALSDYDKLVAYRDEICNAVRYNYDANNPGLNNNPWQVVWVFDGDPSTNVVCEGYAKAFQYLCDMTSFSGSVTCFCATGYLYNRGAHMWNIVRMPNGRNYLVDVTHCDSNDGNFDWTFMKAPVSGSVDEGYRFIIKNGSAYIDNTYFYDEDMVSIYPVSDLIISASDYLSGTSESVPGTTELDLGSDADDAPAATSASAGASTGASAAVDASTGVPTIIATVKRVKATIYAATGSVYQLDLGGATGKKFKSSKKKVATVSGSGLVTIKKAGTAKISFKVGRTTRTVTLTVKDLTVPTAIALNAYGTIAAKKGDSVTLTATLPEGTYSGIKWKSSNKKVATVSNGVVYFKKKGKVTITATTTRGKKKARVKFKVSN